MLADATHDLDRERGGAALWVAPESASAAFARKGIASPEDTPFRAALRTALSDRNVGSAKFLNSLLSQPSHDHV